MVFNDSIFATPRPSFERPVPLVLVDPWDAPLIYLKLNVQWMPYVLGALRQLVLQSTWDTTDPAALDLVQARAMSLINLFTLALQHPAADDCCHEIAMTDSRIKWLPANPFTAPNDVPSGYHFPPWYVAPAHTLIPGVRMGDVVTDILHAPFNPLASGFPRLRITVKGPGTIEVKFVRFPTASIALWTIDGNLGSSQWTDLHVTLEAAIGRFDPEMVIPIAVTGEGDHVIDLSIIASISEEPPFVHFGGGIRSISLCGFGAQIEPTTPSISEMEYLMSVCEQLRFHNGKLQGYCCGEWVDIAGQGGIVIGGSDQQGGGAPQPDPGSCQTYHAQFEANGTYLVPTVVNAGDEITFSNADGSGADGAFLGSWYCPDGGTFFGGLCLPVYSTDAGDPDPTLSHMSLIAKIGSLYYRADTGTITVPGGVVNEQVLLQVNDGTIGDNSGSYALDIEVCNNQSLSWEQIFDFALSPGGWTLQTYGAPGFAGVWTPGVGWVHTDNVYTGFNVRGVNILHASMVDSPVTFLEVLFNFTQGTYDSTPQHAETVYAGAVALIDRATGALVTGANKTLGGIVSGASDDPWQLYFYSDNTAGAPSGAVTIKKITIRGTGVNPFV